MFQIVVLSLFISFLVHSVESLSSICLKCECSLDTSHTNWITSSVLIMCDNRINIDFNNNLVLPMRSSRAIMSNMKLKNVPDRTLLNSFSLYHLDLSNNDIFSIPDGSFESLPHLKYLNLNRNQIGRINSGSFDNCYRLQTLLMSQNLLQILPHRFGDKISSVEVLDVSYNQLGAYFESDGHFLHPNTYGEAPKLLSLNLDSIGLKINEKTNSFTLSGARSLRNLTMCNNLLEVIPNLPRFLEIIDISQTGIKILGPNSFPYLQALHTLIIQDALNLQKVKAYTFNKFPELKTLKLDGCRKLDEFSEHAFGRDVQSTKLEVLTMSGTCLSSLGKELQPVFENLTTFDLSGAPWYCNCSSAWLIPLVTESLHCASPPAISGSSLSDLKPEALLCAPEGPYASTKTAVAVLLAFGSLLLSVVAIWVFCEGAKLSRRIFLQRLPGTPGAESPYGRITVEPNTAERIRV